jgi:hypothetical protein
MLKIDDLQALNQALASDVSDEVAAVLTLRRDLIDLATFVIVDPENSLAEVEAVIGFPIQGDYPPWEWVLDHGGAFEAPVITSDDGSGIVLIVPYRNGVDPALFKVLSSTAEISDPID